MLYFLGFGTLGTPFPGLYEGADGLPLFGLGGGGLCFGGGGLCLGFGSPFVNFIFIFKYLIGYSNITFLNIFQIFS